MKTIVNRAMNATFHGRTMFDVLNEATDYGCELMEAALSAAQQWQLIETAPKDCTKVIGWWRWGTGEDEWCMVMCWQSEEHGWDDGSYGSGGRPKPTHWMPIPEPPK